MTANIRVRASAPALRVAKASAAFRLAVSTPGTVESVCNGIAALDDPNRLLDSVAFLAQRDHYPEAATRLQKYLRPQVDRLVETILTVEIPTVRAIRIAWDFGVVTGQRIPKHFSIQNLIAATSGKKARRAWTAIHVLGFVRSARGGVTAIEETSAARPGIWPAAPAERIALAFNLVVRSAHGERFNSVRLVR